MAEPWQPLLSGADAAHALDLVRAIAADATDPALPHTPAHRGETVAAHTASLAGGHAGLAVFQAHVAHAIGARSTERLSDHLDASDEALEGIAMPVTLFEGFTGIGWANAHIERLIADEAADLDEIDGIILDQLADAWDGHCGLANGLTGLGVYALERLPSARADRMIDMTIDRLREMAVTAGPQVDLGVAHGVSGVVAFLGAACLAGHETTARPLLEDTVPWLLAQQLATAQTGLYPGGLAPGVTPGPTRLAWCRGDAGIASALLLAARGAGRDDWRLAGLAAARQAAARMFETSGVQDAMLCHGAAGVAHLFNRLFQATGEAWLAQAARHWFAQVFRMQRPGSGIAGYQRYVDTPRSGHGGWQTDPGLLTGTAGVALALLAATTEVEPEWDRALLLSARTMGR